jgi:hypothetical protein
METPDDYNESKTHGMRHCYHIPTRREMGECNKKEPRREWAGTTDGIWGLGVSGHPGSLRTKLLFLPRILRMTRISRMACRPSDVIHARARPPVISKIRAIRAIHKIRGKSSHEW